MNDSNDFYVGYLPQAPNALGRWLRRLLSGLLVAIAILAIVLVTRQDRFGHGAFEFGVERQFTGIVLELPYPTLLAMNPVAKETSQEFEPLLLVAFGKHGPASLVEGMHGRPVRIRGTFVHRDGRAMVEVHAVEAIPLEQAKGLVLPDGGVDRGQVTLSGEVVDSKCYLGVMKPGHTKPHRGCAVRCISGGVPPLLLVVNPDGTSRQLLLASAQGRMIHTEVLPYVAERVQITGAVRDHGGLEVLYADPDTYRRLP